MPRSRLIALAVLCATACVASAQQPPKRTERDAMHFLGPVRSVHTVTTYQRGANGPVTPGSTSDVSFREDGPREAMASFTPDGSPLSKQTFRRTPDGMSIVERTEFRGPEVGRHVTTSDDHHRRIEEATYNLDGTLRGRDVYQYGPDGAHEIHYDAAGRVVSEDTRHTTRTIEPDGTRKSQTTTSDGVVVAETDSKRTGEQVKSESTLTISPGTVHSTVVQDRDGTRHVQTGPNGSTFAYATDPSGQAMTSIHVQPDGKEVRTMRHFDAARRDLGSESYIDGTLYSRQIVTYEDDAHGNWTKMVSRAEIAAGEVISISTTTRTITYY